VGAVAVDERLLAALEHAPLGLVGGGRPAVVLADACDRRELASRLVREARLAAARVERVHGGAHDDLEQRVAVEVRGERLADAAHRLLHAHTLLGQLRQALLELARHLVELLAQRRELVMAGGRDLRGEVAAPEPARRLQKAIDLALQRARDDHGEREGQDEEAEQDAAGEQATAPHIAGLLDRRVEHRDQDAAAPEARSLEGRRAEARAP
jgi:hypothetical protein